MTEAEWLACADPIKMLAHFQEDWKTLDDLKRGFPTDRKLERFTIECCRKLWPLLPDERYRRVVDIADGFIEGRASRERLIRAREGIHGRVNPKIDIPAYYAIDYLAVLADRNPRSQIAQYVASKVTKARGTSRELCDLMCEIFGNPFRPVAFDPAWRTSTALAIAEGIYDDRAFDRLPILADALQDAGCENGDILNHLRSLGPHVKGCWALDLVLGKE